MRHTFMAIAFVPRLCPGSRSGTGVLRSWSGFALALAGAGLPGTSRAATAARPPGKAVVPFSMLREPHGGSGDHQRRGPVPPDLRPGAPITLLSNRVSEASGVVKADAPRSFLFSMRGEAEWTSSRSAT